MKHRQAVQSRHLCLSHMWSKLSIHGTGGLKDERQKKERHNTVYNHGCHHRNNSVYPIQNSGIRFRSVVKVFTAEVRKVIEIKMTGICDGCEFADLELHRKYDTCLGKWYWAVQCKHKKACKRLAMRYNITDRIIDSNGRVDG